MPPMSFYGYHLSGIITLSPTRHTLIKDITFQFISRLVEEMRWGKKQFETKKP